MFEGVCLRFRKPADPRSPKAIAHWKDYYRRSDFRTDARERFFAGLISNSCKEGDYVLDIACGNGVLLKCCARENLVGFGLDINATQFCNAVNEVPDIATVESDALALPFADNTFSCVCSIGFLEHLDENEHRKLMSEIRRVLKCGGFLLVHVPIRSPVSRLVRFIRRFVVGDIGPHSIDDDNDPTHKSWFTLMEFRQLVSQSGFRLTESGCFLARSSGKPRYVFAALQPVDWLTSWMGKSRSLTIRECATNVRRFFAFGAFIFARDFQDVSRNT